MSAYPSLVRKAITSSPTANPVTPAPSWSTTPATSLPRRTGRLQTDLLDDAAFHRLDINRIDGRYLDALSEGPMSARSPAQACGVSPNALTTVVDRLAERGPVERIKDPADLAPLADHVSQQLYGPIVAGSLRVLGEYTVEELELIEGFIEAGRRLQAEQMGRIAALELSWEVS